MAALQIRPAIGDVASAGLGLKWALMARGVAVVLFCFCVASAVAFVGTYREVRHVNTSAADILVREMQAQLFRIDSDLDAMTHFPDWSPIAAAVLVPGECVRYVLPDGSIGRSNCVGFNREIAGPPAWFVSLSGWLVGMRVEVTRAIANHDRVIGHVVVTTEPPAVQAAIWKRFSALVGFAALVVAAICLLQYAAVTQVLRPTREIVAGLDRLARGDLSCRLPRFRATELERMSSAFNTLVAKLERTTRENLALAARLVDGQEQARLDLARDLHDELAQGLTAITAIAGSMKATAETDCAALVPEANRLLDTSIGIMRSLRKTLTALRPPEIEDLGLAASLAALAMEQERHARGELAISLALDGGLDGLPLPLASHVYRIVQEGLTNIARHAHANRARITLGFCPDPAAPSPGKRRWLAIRIEDNGRGPVDFGHAADRSGLGLIGIRERVAALGGQLELGSSDSGGLRLHALIPLPAGVDRSS
jgi:signal transduction histidine kinase